MAKRKLLSHLQLAIPFLFIIGCAPMNSLFYTPPVSKEAGSLEVVVRQSFDETWSGLIDYASATFFAIDNYEKDSGLLTLSFGESEPHKYVDCGYVKARVCPQGYSRCHDRVAMEFDGPYAEYLGKFRRAKLSGRMNLSVRRLDEASTRVRINTRYIFQDSWNTTYAFDSGSSATLEPGNRSPGSVLTRTCRPTYLAEQTILEGVLELMNKPSD